MELKGGILLNTDRALVKQKLQLAMPYLVQENEETQLTNLIE